MALFSVFAGLDAASVRLVRTEGGTLAGWDYMTEYGPYHSIVIPAGKVMVINSVSIVESDPNNYSSTPAYYVFYGTQDPIYPTAQSPECVGYGNLGHMQGVKKYIPGPAVFSISGDSVTLTDIEYQFISDRDAGPDVTVPSNAVVIPSNNSGNVQVIMECSEDLVTWAACEPGSRGPGNNGKFFRVRVEKENP